MKALENADMFFIEQLLNKCLDIPNAKISWAVARSLARVESYTKKLKKLIEKSDKYKKYIEAGKALQNEFALKDKNGDPKTQVHFWNNEQIEVPKPDPEKSEEMELKNEELSEEYHLEIKANKAQKENWDEKIKDPVDKEFKFYKFKKSELKKAKLSVEKFAGIIFLIDGKVTEKDIPKDKNAKAIDYKTIIDYCEL